MITTLDLGTGRRKAALASVFVVGGRAYIAPVNWRQSVQSGVRLEFGMGGGFEEGSSLGEGMRE